MGEVTVVVEQPFDWVAAVIVPVAAVLVSSAIAVFIAGRQERAAQRARVRNQVADLIRALSTYGYVVASHGSRKDWLAASIRYESELNALAAMLPSREIAIPRFICEVVNRADIETLGVDGWRRVTLWASTALELWARGVLRTSDFVDNMPPRESWVDAVELGEWDALLRGAPVVGVFDLTPAASGGEK